MSGLVIITFLPIIAGCILALAPLPNDTVRKASLAVTLAILAISIPLMWNFGEAYRAVSPEVSDAANSPMPFVYETNVKWIETFNINFHIGVDGLSMPFVFLTAFLCPLCILASWGIGEKVRGYFALFLLLEGGMIGTFVALDLFLFYVFWELMLLPMYFLIGIWGGPRKEYAAIKFFLYTLFGSIFLFIAMLVLYWKTGTFSLVELPGHEGLGDLKWWVQIALFLGLYVAFAIKIPAFPFHTWLPDAHVEAPTAISVILAGILLKMGTYAIFRISFPIFPVATAWFCTPLAVLAVINIVYGALCAMAQTDFKKLVAYSSISHMGFVMLGMAVYKEEAMQGAVFQMFNHGCITAMLFLLVGVIYDRAHHRDLAGFGGLVKPMPLYGGYAAFAFFAALGLPGLSGFISESLVFLGAFQEQKLLACIGTLGILLGAAYMLWTYQRVFMGPVNEKYKDYKDMNKIEIASLLPLAVMVLVLGIFPFIFLDMLAPTVSNLLAHLHVGREEYEAMRTAAEQVAMNLHP
ncbi:MAG: NADH-quinone oxidoreductase subunit M [Candidatus Omnitrophica bacterium]|nr:NADH-quinone oxidoreductase subunit M [Candidatus Omnitrophota bacterium]